MAARWAPFLALLITGMSLGALAQDAAPSFRQLVREGHRLRSTGNLRGASAKYGAAIEAAANDGELAEALQAHAVAQRNLGRDDQAEADLRRAIALPNAGALRRPAMLQLAALLEAQTRLDEAIELYLNVAAGLRDRPEEAAQTLLTAARLLLDSDRLQEAREALAGVEPEALPPQLRSEAAGLRLEVALASGDVAAAQAAIREAGVEGADLSQLHVRLARLLFEDDRPDEALAACEAAIEADPANSSAWRVQLDIATAKGTADALVSQVEARLRADPGNEVLAQRVAYYAEWDEDADRALAAFRSLLALRPQDSALLERAGARAAQSGRNAEALEFYEAALKLQPDDAGLCFMIGEAHAKLGNRAQAVAALEQGTRFRPGDPESAQRLGMTLARAGLHDEAAALYRETRELLGDPDALAYELAEALAPVRPEEALGEYLRAAAGGLDEATLVAPEAVRLARSADLLPRLADLAQATLAERPVAGVALLLAVTEAALGRAGESVERLQSLGLAPPELMAIAESLEAQGVREAAADLYATVVTHPDASAGLRLELAVRAAETQIALGRPEDARTVLAAALAGGAGPASLAEPAAFLLADLDLAAGRNLAQARETFAALTRYSTHPDLPRRARWRLADLAFAEGDYAAAEERFAQLAQEPPSLDIALPPAPPGFLIPRNGLPLMPDMPLDDLPQADPRTTPAYAAVRIAECAFRKGEFDRAKALFAETAEEYPDSGFANDAVDRRLLIATHFTNPRPATDAYLAALRASLSAEWPEAVASLRRVAEGGLTEPLADDAALLIGSLLETHGQPAEAAARYRALPAAFPGSLLAPEALLSAARVARSLGNDAQAREDLTTLLRNYPSSPMAKTAALWLDDLEHGRAWSAP